MSEKLIMSLWSAFRRVNVWKPSVRCDTCCPRLIQMYSLRLATGAVPAVLQLEVARRLLGADGLEGEREGEFHSAAIDPLAGAPLHLHSGTEAAKLGGAEDEAVAVLGRVGDLLAGGDAFEKRLAAAAGAHHVRRAGGALLGAEPVHAEILAGALVFHDNLHILGRGEAE